MREVDRLQREEPGVRGRVTESVRTDEPLVRCLALSARSRGAAGISV